MTGDEVQEFVTRFAAAWAARDGEAFLALWHPDGVLHSPLYDRPVAGNELGRLTEIVKERAPDSVWQLLDWRGVDKFRLREGRIVEERVYADTAPLRAVAKGEAVEPLVALGPG